VYSHLRRSGYTVTRSTEKSDLQKQLWRVAASAADCPAEVLVVRPDEKVLQCLLGQTAPGSWEGRARELHARVTKGLGVAVSAAGAAPLFWSSWCLADLVRRQTAAKAPGQLPPTPRKLRMRIVASPRQAKWRDSRAAAFHCSVSPRPRS
ncbi:unnamed protein product, partial [Symbiodinium sp. KB8]